MRKLFCSAAFLVVSFIEAAAAPVRANVEVDFPAVLLPVFGLTEPTTANFSFLIDPNDYAFHYAPGDQILSGTELVAETELFGFSRDSIRGLAFQVGDTVFNKPDLAEFGISNNMQNAAVWFDSPLSTGATPNIALRFLDPQLFVGNVLCKVSRLSTACSLYSVVDVGTSTTPLNTVRVQITSPNERVSPIPAPPGLVLMLSGALLGLLAPKLARLRKRHPLGQ